MNSSGDAAEQVVRLSLEGLEVVAKVSGEAAKSIAVLLISALKQEQKTKGRARLTNMIKSGKELKVYTVQQKDLKEFTKHAKKYGVLYTVLRDKNNKDKNAFVDIISRADDASKIQRIIDRFDLATVDKGTIVSQSEKAIEERKKKAEEKTAKTVAEKPEKRVVKKTEEKAAKPTKQTAKKPEEKTAKEASARKTEAEKLASAVPGQVKPEAAKEPVVKKEVTPNGVTYTTGQIPITVVQPPKSAKRSQVPIYTLEREPVPLTREAPADQLDDDFEFEFIDIDS